MRAFPLLFVACAGVVTAPTTPTPTGGPRGLRATEHRQVAASHDELAREQRSFPVISAEPQHVPWYRTWDPAHDHALIARAHRTEASALEAAYAEACGTRELATISESPLTRHRLGGWNTSTGVVVYLAPTAGTADALLADLKCHRAWMMLAPTASMDDCPLDLPGLLVDARGDANGVTLVITVDNRRLVPELQRRIAKELEH